MQSTVPNQIQDSTINTLGYTPAETYMPEDMSSQNRGNPLSRASSWVSKKISENPILGGTLKTAVGAGIGMLSGGLSLPMALGVSALTNMPGAVSSQADVLRQRSLYNPSIHASYSGAFNGSGTNTQGLVAINLRRMHASAPSHLKPALEKYMKRMGISPQI